MLVKRRRRKESPEGRIIHEFQFLFFLVIAVGVGLYFRLYAVQIQSPNAWGPDASQAYLHGADSYYYYGLTKRIQDLGHLSDQVEKGKFFHPLRYAPDGVWSSVTLHPFVGLAWYQTFKKYKPGISLIEALCSLPLVLYALAVFSFFFLGRALKGKLFAVFLGSLVFSLSPIFIQRSVFGWYDTDAYNLIFPNLILGFFAAGIRSSKGTLSLCAVCAGLLTALYSCFWQGWPLLFFLVLALSLFMLLMQGIRIEVHISSTFRFLGLYLAVSLISLAVLMTPQGFFSSVFEAYLNVNRFLTRETSAWPNAFIAVGETQGVSLIKLIQTVSNPVSAGMAALGLVFYALGCGLRKERFDWAYWYMMLLVAVVFLYFSMRTYRFALLFVIPLSVFVMWGADSVLAFMRARWERLSRDGPVSFWKLGIVYAVLFFLICPAQLSSAQEAAMTSTRIMNDAWYGILTDIRDQTPKDSVIVTSWSPGHFVTAVAERKVFVDGGSQHIPEDYWVSRFFMAEEESKALGILKMLNAGGNDAVDYLRSEGYALADAVDLINGLLGRSRSEMEKQLQDKMTPEKRGRFLNLMISPESSAPNFVFIFDEMMEKNIAMSLAANWNFRKAAETKQKNRSEKKLVDRLFQDKKDYLSEILALSGKILKDTPAVPMSQRDGDFIRFENGVVVNEETLEAFIQLPETDMGVRPYSLFFVQAGELTERVSPKAGIEPSVLFWRGEDTYYSVLAHPELIRSMLYRFYYLKGHTLKHFSPLLRRHDPRRKNWFYVFRVDWPEGKT